MPTWHFSQELDVSNHFFGLNQLVDEHESMHNFTDRRLLWSVNDSRVGFAFRIES